MLTTDDVTIDIDWRFSLLVNRTNTIKEILNTRKIKVQVAAVAGPPNQIQLHSV